MRYRKVHIDATGEEAPGCNPNPLTSRRTERSASVGSMLTQLIEENNPLQDA